jgi:hypothetical protein
MPQQVTAKKPLFAHFWNCRIPNFLLICWGPGRLQMRKSPISFTPSVADLQPDRLLRLLLLIFAAILHLAGFVLLLGTPLPGGALVLLVLAWSWLCLRDWRNQLRAYRRVAAIRICSDGCIETVDMHGQTERVQLRAGSLILPRVAWLRLEFADRSHFGELLSGDARRCARWHWLQLASRQHGARFGRPDRS